MKSVRLIAYLAASLALAACGGADKSTPGAEEPASAAQAGAPEHAEHGEQAEHGGHAHRFPPAVDAFHAVLAPLWHAEPGPARVADTCQGVGELESKAQAIQTAPMPESLTADQEPAWREAGQTLLTSIDALETACNADGRPDFDASFIAAHDAFHGLVDLLGHH